MGILIKLSKSKALLFIFSLLFLIFAIAIILKQNSESITLSVNPAVGNSSYNALATYDKASGRLEIEWDFDNELTHESLYRGGRSHSKIISITPGIYDVTINVGADVFVASLVVGSDINTSSSKVLVIVPDYTWHAYNKVGGESLYSKGNTGVSMVRPLARPSWYHQPSYNPLAFLRENNIEFDLLAQSSFYNASISIDQYRLILLYGHDEYWTDKMMQDFNLAIDSGVNVLNLSGNTGWWRLKRQGFRIDRNLGYFHDNGIPQENFLGISFRFFRYPMHRKVKEVSEDLYQSLIKEANFPPTIRRKDVLSYSQGVLVTNAEHPVFKGVALESGSWLGVSKKLLDIEVDGLRLDKINQLEGRFVSLAEGWTAYRVGKQAREKVFHSAIFTEFTKNGGGTVISFPTIGWLRMLQGDSEVYKRITLNAINYLMDIEQ